MRRPAGVALVALLLAGTSGGCGSQDDGTNVPPAERAYARVISDPADLIGGPLAQGQLGDILIGNAKVRFIIQGKEHPRGYLPFGGTVIDADLVRPAGDPGQDHLQEIGVMAGYGRAVDPEQVEVIHDGSNGRPAQVRVIGKDGPIPIVSMAFPFEPSEATVTIDYVLEPGASSLRIDSTFTDRSGGPYTRDVVPGDGMVLGDLTTVCAAPEPGCELTGTPSQPTALIGYAPGLVSYSYFVPGDTVAVLLKMDEFWLVNHTSFTLGPGVSETQTRYLAVSDGALSDLLPERLRREGVTELRRIAGGVTLEGGEPAVGAAVDLRDESGDFVTRTVADEAGAFAARVPPARYQLVASLPARPASAPVDADVETTDASALDLVLARPAVVRLDIRDDDGAPLPARIAFLAGTAPDPGASPAALFFTTNGVGDLVVEPGDYVAAVTRGFEYTAELVPVQAVAGQTVVLQASLAHVVDTTGFLSADLHSHFRPSPDSQVSDALRIAQAAGEHVELVVTTDHDIISNLAPAIQLAGAGDVVATAQGVEISPIRGHVNAYPVSETNAHRHGYWPLAWWQIDEQGEVGDARPYPEIFAAARSELGAQIIQLNHPRDGAAVLDTVHYDPAVGLAGLAPEVMDDNFDAIEVCNSSFGAEDAEAVLDWYSFLNQGLPIVGVGVSDYHGGGAGLGKARTLVEVPDDVLAPGYDTAPFFTALRGQRATVVIGPFVVIRAVEPNDAEVGMGRMAAIPTGPVRLHVTVQAAPFVETSRLRIIGNGVEVLLVDLPAPADPPAALRYDEIIDLPWTGGDAWFVAVVEGDRSMAPLYNDSPRGITNPVYVDRNGNGQFDAPGL